jgi:hypothetical protein
VHARVKGGNLVARILSNRTGGSMSARSLTFASLLLAAAPPALAETPAQVAAPAPGQPADSVPLSPRWSTSVKGTVLVARLTLVNTGDAPVDLLVRRGSSPGPSVIALVDGTQLVPVLDPSQEREVISRMGPMPVYAPVAGAGEVEVGTFRFTLPKEAAGKAIRFETTVRTADGRHAVLATSTVVGGSDA